MSVYTTFPKLHIDDISYKNLHGHLNKKYKILNASIDLVANCIISEKLSQVSYHLHKKNSQKIEFPSF